MARSFPQARPAHAAEPVERMLNFLRALSEDERATVRRLTGSPRRSPLGDELCGPGWNGARIAFLTSGWACRQRILADGRRQIFSVLLPGDLIDCHRLMSFGSSIAVTALTDVETVDARAVLEAAEAPAMSGLDQALDLQAAREERGLYDHIVRLGRLTAYERVAHMLLDVRDRLEVVGLAVADSFPMPLTQETLADVLGLSNVHVNRVLQQLRRDGMLVLEGGRASLPRAGALALACAYSPGLS